MSKVKELSHTLDDMIRCGEDLIRVAQEVKAIFSETEPEPVAAGQKDSEQEPAAGAQGEAEPVNVPEVSVQDSVALDQDKGSLQLTDVRAFLAEKSRMGFTAQVKALLKKHGAGRLSEIAPAEYEALMEEARLIGNG